MGRRLGLILLVAGLAAAPAFVPTAAGDGSDAFAVSTLTLDDHPYLVFAQPLDGDAYPELVAITAAANLISAPHSRVFKGSARGAFTPFWSAPMPPGDYCTGPTAAMGDIDGDEHIDLVLANTPHYGAGARLGDGTGRLPTYILLDKAQFSAIADVELTHLDGDGIVDMVFVNTEFCVTGYLEGSKGNGDGSFVWAGGSFLSADPQSRLASGDADGDGLPDWFIASSSGLSIARGKVSLGFAYEDPVELVDAQVRDVVTADLNADGEVDLVFTLPLSDQVGVLRGRGDGTFIGPALFATASQPQFLAVADLDGDAIPDVALTAEVADAVAIHHGVGNGTLSAGPVVAVGEHPLGIAAADFDADGDVDLVTANPGDQTLSVLLNQQIR